MAALPIIEKAAKELWKSEFIPAKDNRTYPDATIIGCIQGGNPPRGIRKIAIDVKTAKTSNKEGTRCRFTLGSYHGYFASPDAKGAIMFPYREYDEHWIVGFPYSLEPCVMELDGIKEKGYKIKVQEPIIQPKWKLAGTSSGTGTTFHIGSISDIKRMRKGEGLFQSEEAFRKFWLAYEKLTTAQRAQLAKKLTKTP